MKEQHPTEEQLKERENIKCQYCQKKFKTKDNRNEHELGCVANKDREELKCEVCDLGGVLCQQESIGSQENVPWLGRING